MSIIIPSYNVKDCLTNAVDSIINQSIGFENIELILVDDNSNDGTQILIKNFSDSYENIICIFLDKNSGSASVPRNKGLEVASADYVMFLDADDFYYPEMCEKLYNTIISDDVDIVSSRFNYYTNGITKNPKSIFDKYDNLIKVDSIYDFPKIMTVGFTTQLINKMYKKNIILENDILFPEGEQNEDIYFAVKYYLVANGIIILNDYYGYAYNLRGYGESISVTFNLTNLVQMTNGLLSIFNLFKAYNQDFFNFKGELLLGWTKWFIFTDLRNDKEIQKQLLNQTKIYFKSFPLFTRILSVSLTFNIIINICYKIFGVFPRFLIVLSNLRNIFVK